MRIQMKSIVHQKQQTIRRNPRVSSQFRDAEVSQISREFYLSYYLDLLFQQPVVSTKRVVTMRSNWLENI